MSADANRVRHAHQEQHLIVVQGNVPQMQACFPDNPRDGPADEGPARATNAMYTT